MVTMGISKSLLVPTNQMLNVTANANKYFQ